MVKKAAQATPNRLLRAARQERGWTQQQLADLIGAPQPLNVTRWERGVAFPSAYYTQKLAQVFERSPRDLGLLPPEGESDEQQEHVPAGRLWQVPYRRNPFFTGRQQVLAHLQDQLSQERAVALIQSYALSGLGGIGKTQVAVEYAYRTRQAYHAIFWVRAASRETLLADFVTIAELLDLPGHDAQDQNQVVAAVKRWLVEHQEWLLILDNADDLPLVSDFLPAGGEGHLLLTTRAQATGKLASSIAVEKMNLDEGSLLLLRRAKLLALEAPLSQAPVVACAEARTIVQALDGLPLALDQAGAYIEETGCSLAEYLVLYQQRRSDLLNRQSSVSSDYPYTVASTWSLSFQQVEQANPAAADLLRLCAFLDPDAIPEAIITEGAPVLGPVLEPVVADAFQLNEAIQVLRRFSLIRRDGEAKVLNIHRLVQAVLKDRMDAQTQRQWAERALRTVNAAFPEVSFPNWERCQQCLPHVRACAELIDSHHLTFPEVAGLLNHAGFYMRERGLYGPAELLLTRTLAIREHALGSEHPDTATTLSDLAWLYNLQGHYAHAESLYQRALTIREQVLGDAHPDVAESLNDLAVICWNQGKYEQAIGFYLRSLTIREHMLESNHPDVAIRTRVTSRPKTLNHLAFLHLDQSQYEQVETIFQRAHAIWEKAGGPNHPRTAATLNSLAYLYQAQGRYEQAESIFRRALAIREQALGPNHPDVATSLNNLAWSYHARGQDTQAEPLYQRALAICERELGPEHPDTAITLHRLAQLYEEQGHDERAKPLYQRALAIREKVLGPEHPDTVAILKDDSELLRKMQKTSEQAKLFFHHEKGHSSP